MRNLSRLNRAFRIFFQETTIIHLSAALYAFTFRRLWNFLLVNLQYLLRLETMHGRPYTLTIDTNNICNLTCALCPTGRKEMGRERGVMGFEEFKDVFDQFSPHIFILHLYAWGEPLLTPEIFRMISYARESRVFVSLSTNLNFPQETMEKILDSGLHHLIVGLDGSREEIYSKYRRGGDFDLVVQNLKRLVVLKSERRLASPFIQVLFLAFQHNQDDIRNMESFCRRLGVDALDIIKGAWSYDKGYLTSLSGIQERDKSGKRCIFPWNKALIHWDGGVSPCIRSRLKNDDYGNLFDEDFASIWNSTSFRLLRRKHCSPESVEASFPCDTCPKWR